MKKLCALAVAFVFIPSLAFALTVQPATPGQFNSSNSGAISACKTLQGNGLGGIVDCVLSILDRIVILLIAGAVVYIIWGAFQMISSEEKRASGKATITYGIIGLFVMVSVWGLVNILSNTFNLTAGPIAPVQLYKK